MLARQHFSLRVIAMLIMTITLVLTSAPFASAQDEKPSSVVGNVIKGVVFDPTTYAPAIIGYHSTMKDWNTSQPFFKNGYVEHNARFTVSGRSDDTAVSYGEGRDRILRDAMTALTVAAAQNATSRLIEQALLARYPDHRKAVKAVGWIQRIAVGSLMSYHLSASHYRQARINAQRSAELGLR
jgi:hypothetical protein